MVHHKTYCNIGKEPLSDLVALCEECHERVHEPYVPSDPQSPAQPGQAYWGAFKTYVKKKEKQLQLFPEPDLPSFYGIQIDRKTLKSADIYEDNAIWLVAYRDANKLQANLCMQSSVHYNVLKEQEEEIKGEFDDNLGVLRCDDDGKRIGFWNNIVGDVGEANTDKEFPWLHDRLIRLHEVFQPIVSKL